MGDRFDTFTSDEEFDKELIPLYDSKGYPHLDDFEYIDALLNNKYVEERRTQFHRRQKKQFRNPPTH